MNTQDLAGNRVMTQISILFTQFMYLTSIVFYTPMSIGSSSTSSVNRPLISLPETFKVKTKWERLLWWFLENDGSYSNDKKLQKKKQITKGKKCIDKGDEIHLGKWHQWCTSPKWITTKDFVFGEDNLHYLFRKFQLINSLKLSIQYIFNSHSQSTTNFKLPL